MPLPGSWHGGGVSLWGPGREGSRAPLYWSRVARGSPRRWPSLLPSSRWDPQVLRLSGFSCTTAGTVLAPVVDGARSRHSADESTRAYVPTVQEHVPGDLATQSGFMRESEQSKRLFPFGDTGFHLGVWTAWPSRSCVFLFRDSYSVSHLKGSHWKTVEGAGLASVPAPTCCHLSLSTPPRWHGGARVGPWELRGAHERAQHT